MATLSFYNHTAKRYLSGENSQSDTYKIVLLSAAAVFDATDEELADVTVGGALEVYGYNFPQGGATVQSVAAAVGAAGAAVLGAADLVVPIIGGDLGPFSSYVLVNATDDALVFFLEMDAPVTVTNGKSLHIPWTDGAILSMALAV